MKLSGIVSLLVAIAIASFSPVGFAAEEVSSIARGGRLYDKWFKVIGAPKPSKTHHSWPASNNRKKGNTTHRCKSCHGWDLMGKDGGLCLGFIPNRHRRAEAYGGRAEGEGHHGNERLDSWLRRPDE